MAQWSAFWANAVKLGGEMGAAFGEGLMQAASLDAALDLKGKLGGHRPTTVAAMAQLMRGLTSLDLSDILLSAEEAKVVAGALATSGSLTQVLSPHFRGHIFAGLSLRACLSMCAWV